MSAPESSSSHAGSSSSHAGSSSSHPEKTYKQTVLAKLDEISSKLGEMNLDPSPSFKNRFFESYYFNEPNKSIPTRLFDREIGGVRGQTVIGSRPKDRALMQERANAQERKRVEDNRRRSDALIAEGKVILKKLDRYADFNPR
jgi:hypothetical protein